MQCREKRGWRSAVAEGLADVDEAVHVAGTKDKASAELKGVFPKPVLLMAACVRPLAGDGIVPAEEMEQGSVAQTCGAIRFTPLVDEKREGDAGLFAEKPCVKSVTQTDGGQARTAILKGIFLITQLRDVLAAEDSTIVAEENQDCGVALPQGA